VTTAELRASCWHTSAGYGSHSSPFLWDFWRMKQRYTASQVIDALRHTKGLVHQAAKLLRCDPETIQNYCKRYPPVQQAKQDARAELLDLATLQLIHAVERGDMWAILFTLRTLGKDRGWSTLCPRCEQRDKARLSSQSATVHLWEERLQAVHKRLQAEREAIRAQRALEAGRNGQGGDAEGGRS
jgi:hypothetical protein